METEKHRSSSVTHMNLDIPAAAMSVFIQHVSVNHEQGKPPLSIIQLVNSCDCDKYACHTQGIDNVACDTTHSSEIIFKCQTYEDLSQELLYD